MATFFQGATPKGPFPRPPKDNNGLLFNTPRGQGVTFTPVSTSGDNPSFDFTTLGQGIDTLRGVNFTPKPFTPFQFSNPTLQNVNKLSLTGGPNLVGPRASVGDFGRTSAEQFQELRNSALQSALRPLRAQSEARARALNQGFGASAISGAAKREILRKNALDFGQQVGQISGDLNTSILNRQLQQDETARAKNFDEKQRIAEAAQLEKLQQQTAIFKEKQAQAISQLENERAARDLAFKAELARQARQAALDFNAAGFSNNQAQFLANLGLEKAKGLIDSGGNVIKLQNLLESRANSQLLGLLNGFGSLFNTEQK